MGFIYHSWDTLLTKIDTVILNEGIQNEGCVELKSYQSRFFSRPPAADLLRITIGNKI